MEIEVGVIGGTGASLTLEDARETELDTPFGPCAVSVGTRSDRPVGFIRRHGIGHHTLSSSVNHRAHVWALHAMGARAVLATTVCGIVDPVLPLARAILFDDLFFPDNRLPGGEPCTFFSEPGDPTRGHFIFDRPFSPGLRSQVRSAAGKADIDIIHGGTYAYCQGPRFNTRAEIAVLRSAGACAVSQTAGPEAVLAGELELPYCLVGFGVDYANGVKEEPTPVEVLNENIERAVETLDTLVGETIAGLQAPDFDTGFVYRTEKER